MPWKTWTPTFAENVQPGDVIVAGRNWGNGSSREQAVTCLVHAGVKSHYCQQLCADFITAMPSTMGCW